ncbi:PIG-L deacetylase family protein [Rhodovastum atsumiense]|nr:PIG-L deacetylase family protein [Rhodovastum atsumiense]
MRTDEILWRLRDLPCADLDTIAAGTALILAPHPDDESLGCGGLIAAASVRGRPPVVVVLTDGNEPEDAVAGGAPVLLRTRHEAETRTATELLGLPRERLHFLGLPKARLPQSGPGFDQVVEQLVALARRHEVDTVCTTWQHDPHADHAAAYWIGAAVARRIGGKLRSYPVWIWTQHTRQDLAVEDIAGWRLDITADLSRKRRAIAAHASQCTAPAEPDGCRLSAEVMQVFDRSFEVFLLTE